MPVVMLGLVVGVLTPMGSALAQSTPGDLARPSTADLAADQALTVEDAPPIPPEILDFEVLANEVLAVLDQMPADEWLVADVAVTLGAEPEAAFEFVRDHIAFDPYAGSLRSPQGTLAARAGNSWDRALLLQALLEAGSVETRLASGDLDDVSAIVQRALEGASEPLARPPMTEVMPFAIEAMTVRARRDHASVVETLGGDYDSLGATSGDDEAIATEHAWLQILDEGGDWLDLDPTLADATPGDTLTSAETTFDEVPPEAQHQLGIRLVAESLTDDGPSSEAVLDETLPASLAADSDMWLLFAPENSGSGGTLAGVLGEAGGWVPTLFMHGDTRAGEAFSIGADSDEGGGTVLDDALGGLGGGEAIEGDAAPLGLTELRLELTSSGPGLEPRTVERILMDGSADEAQPASFSDAHHILASNGGFDLRRLAVARGAVTGMAADILTDPDGAEEYRLIDKLLPWAVADRTLAAVSEHVITPGLGEPGELRAYVGRPRAWIVSHGLDADTESFDGTIDLALDDISLVGTPGTDSSELAQERLWYGVLQTALETETARKRVRRSGDGATLSSVSIDTAGGLTRLDGTSETTDVSVLAAALAGGALALGASYPTTGSFWTVDPATGATTSVQEPGVRPSRYGGSYPGGGGGSYRIGPGYNSTRLNGPSRHSGGGGMEYQVVQFIGSAAAVAASFGVGWLIGRAIANVLDWMYSD
jgi:hypothetical protein